MQVIKVIELAAKARSAAFSPDGEHLAVGLSTGGLHVFAFHPSVQQVHWSAAAAEAISVLAYSPDGKLLAAGGHDQCASPCFVACRAKKGRQCVLCRGFFFRCAQPPCGFCQALRGGLGAVQSRAILCRIQLPTCSCIQLASTSCMCDIEWPPARRHIHLLAVDRSYAKVGSLAGHSSTVRSIDWSCDGATIMSMDQAYETLHFDVKRAATSKACQRDRQWASWTNVLGFPVMGIWPSGSDGTDVNAVDRSPDGSTLVTCDDFGKVLLRACCGSCALPCDQTASLR